MNRQRLLLALILLGYLAVTLGYGVINPLFEAPDEHWHFFTAAAIAVDWAEVGFAPQSQLVLNVTLVPEPAAWVLMAAGLAGIGVMRRRQG